MPDSPARRVVITGAGLISPLGNSIDRLWEGLSSGRSGIDRLRRVPADFLPTEYGGEAWDFSGHIDDFGPLEPAQKKTIRKGLKVMCREIQMGVAAAQLALGHAGLKPGGYDVQRTGVLYGSDYIVTMPDEFAEGVRHCLSGDQQFDFSRWGQEGMPKVTPLWLLKYLPNMPASHIAIYNDLRGPNNSITLREASANLALAEAFCTLVRNSADTMLVGATGSRVTPLRTVHVILQEEMAVNGDPARMCRPFDLNRSGLVLGEGAGAVVAEELETARARGATILGEIVGYGSSTVLDRQGIADCATAVENVLRQALRTSGMTPDEVGHVNAHGVGTRRCDADEAQGINRVFGQRRVPVVAAKSYFGNPGAGGGMIELIASLLAFQHDQLFPILNYETPDPECPITPAGGDDGPGDSFVSVNVSPQGQASAVMVRRFTE